LCKVNWRVLGGTSHLTGSHSKRFASLDLSHRLKLQPWAAGGVTPIDSIVMAGEPVYYGWGGVATHSSVYLSKCTHSQQSTIEI